VTEALVLSEADALEVLAYLITAARTQLDEAAEYGPLRLMGAARILAAQLPTSVSPALSTLVAAVDALPATATPRADRDAYIARLDQLCVAVADCLLDTAKTAEPK
jgi:Family of unknown function (DUF6092)